MIYSSNMNIPIGSSTLLLSGFSFLVFDHRFVNTLNSIKLFFLLKGKLLFSCSELVLHNLSAPNECSYIQISYFNNRQ